MFYFLSKTLYILLMPITWLFLLMGGALLVRSERWRKRLLAGALIFLYVAANPYLSNRLMIWWEVPPTPIADLSSPYDVAVVLSGVTNNFKSPEDRVYLNKGADRIMHTVLLYKKGMVKKILITGGYTKLSGEWRSEARLMKEVMVLSGVPEADIMIEEQARNTRENAVFAAEMLKESFPGQRYLLITSAFHMRRSMGCFRKAGIEATPFSTDFYTIDPDMNPLTLLVPTEPAFATNYVLVHEIVGYIVYRLVGYAA